MKTLRASITWSLITLSWGFISAGCDSNLRLHTKSLIESKTSEESSTSPTSEGKSSETTTQSSSSEKFNLYIETEAKERFSDDALTKANQPILTWGDADEQVESFKVRISSTPQCNGTIFEYENITDHSKNLDFLRDGNYHMCVFGMKKDGSQIEAANNGLKLSIDRTPPVIVGETVLHTKNTIVPSLSFDDMTAVTVQWENLSGPGSSTISDARAVNPTIAITAEGKYEYSLVATDELGNMTTSKITVYGDRTPPVVTLGADVITTTSTVLTPVLDGDAFIVDWSVDTGPSGGSIVFSDPHGRTTSVTGNVDGDYTVRITVRDEAGNLGTDTLVLHWYGQKTQPVVSLTGAPAGSNSQTTLAVSVTSATAVEYRYALLDGPSMCSGATYSAWLALSTPITDPIGADGMKRLCVEAREVPLASLTTAVEENWTKDTVAPTATLSGTPADPSNGTALNVTVAGPDMSQYQYALMSGSNCTGAIYGAWTAVSVPITSAIGADGQKTLCILGRDAALNVQSTPTFYSWVNDTTAPTATHSGEPNNPSNATSLNVTIAGTGVVQYQYALLFNAADCSGAAYGSMTAVSTPITDALGGDGNYRLCMKGQDDTQNLQVIPTTYAWTKDTTGAVATISGTPSNPSSSTNLNAVVGGTNIVDYKYAVVDAADCSTAVYSAFISVATPIGAAIGTDGQKTLCVLGRNAASTVQVTPTSYSWIKDTVTPTANLSGLPSNPSADGSLNVSVSSGDSDVVDYQSSLLVGASDCTTATFDLTQGGPWVSKATAITSATGADGSHTLCVIARDAAGNVQGTATAYTWVKDTTAPTATLSGTPANPSSTTPLNVTVAGTDVVEYQYSIVNGIDCSTASYGSWIAVATPITDALTGDGNKILCVIGRDTVQNAQSTATSYSWVHDTTPPTASLTGTPNSFSSATNLAVTVEGTDVAEYQFDLLSGAADCSGATYGAWTPVATQITAAIGADGTKRLCVRGRDTALNAQTSPTSYAWTKDTIAPTATISGAPTGTSNATALNVTVSGTDVNEYQYSLVDGTDCSSASYGVWIAVATPITAPIGADGNKTLCVLGRDSTLNSQSTATSASWSKDTVPPTATLSGTPANPSNGSVLTGTVGGTEVTDYQYALLAGASCTGASYGSWIPVATALPSDSLTALGEGSITVCVKGRDTAGNVQSSPTSATWTRDITPPTATQTGAPSGVSSTTGLDITVGGTDVVSYQYKLGPTSTTDCTSSTGYSANRPVSTHITDIISGYDDGSITVCIVGIDTAGNMRSYLAATSASWTKDALNPNPPSNLSFTNPASGELDLSWTSGGSSDQVGYMVIRRPTSAVSFTPTDGTSYSVGYTSGSNVVVYKGATNAYADTGLTNGTKYYYKIVAYDVSNKYSSGTTDYSTPFVPPAQVLSAQTLSETLETTTTNDNAIATDGAYVYIVDAFKKLKIYSLNTDGSMTLVSNGAITFINIVSRLIIDGNTLFALGSSDLSSIDVTTRSAPLPLQNLSGFVTTTDFDMSTDNATYRYFYVVGNSSNVRIVNALNPSSMSIVNTFDNFIPPRGVRVVGDKMFTCGSSGYRTSDITDRVNPVGNTSHGAALACYAIDVDTSRTWFYLTDGATLRQYSVATESSVNSYSYNTSSNYNTRKLKIFGSYLYALDASFGVQIANINPTTGALTFHSNQRSPNMSGFSDFDVYGTTLMVGGLNGLKANTARQYLAFPNPSIEQTQLVSGTGWDLVYDPRGYIYQVDWGSSINVFKLSSTGNSLSNEGAITGIVPEQLALTGNYLYTTNSSSGFTSFDVTNPKAPTLVKTTTTAESARAFAIGGTYAFFSSVTGVVTAYDISNHSSPTTCNSFTANVTYRLDMYGTNYLFISTVNGIEIWSVATPCSVQPTNVTYLNHGSSRMTVFKTIGTKNYAFVRTDSAGIKIYDITTITSPTLVTTIGASNGGAFISLDDDLLYTGTSNGMEIANVTNISSPQIVGRMNFNCGNCGQVLGRGNWAYFFGTTNSYAYTIDVSTFTP